MEGKEEEDGGLLAHTHTHTYGTGGECVWAQEQDPSHTLRSATDWQCARAPMGPEWKRKQKRMQQKRSAQWQALERKK